MNEIGVVAEADVPAVSPVEHLATRGRLDQLFIGGEWTPPRAPGRTAVVDPSTEERIAEIALGDAADVDRAIAAAKGAFKNWAATAPAERADLLDRIRALILDRAEIFAQALSLEMGAAISFARAAHVPFAAEHIRVARDSARSYPFVTQRGTTAILREPIGVCALITPWNWPLYQITAKVGPALAAGCTVVLKPSELSPLSAFLFAEVMEEAGIPAGVFNLVNGTGPEVGAALAEHPDVDMISITGSTRAGVLVAQAAAPSVKRVTQELGGKSPNVILPDADLERAVAPGVASAFRNVGQSCSAPTRMIVPREKLAAVEALARSAASQFVVGDPRDERTTHGPVANRAQFDRVQEHDRHRHRGRRAARLRRARASARPEPRLLRPADHLFGRRQEHGDRPGGNFRARPVPHALRQRRGGDRHRQRHYLWTWRARAGERPCASTAGGCADPVRAGPHQLPAVGPERAVRWIQKVRQRARIWHRGS